jgi:hypothetical protein
VATNFDLAPPPVTVGGVTIVPVDIQTVDARLVFDGASSTATGDATITFIVGPTSGRAMFDLRQPITGVMLDGTPLPIGQILTRDLGGGAGAEMRVLDTSLGAGSTHTLRLTYSVGLPLSPAGGGYPPGLAWTAGPRLAWNLGFTDLFPARYLESWVPANLIWDQFAITFDIEVVGTAVAHTLITNGTLTVLAINHWRAAFPASSTAMSTLLELRATDALSQSSTVAVLPSGTSLTLEASKLATNAAVSLGTQLASLSGWLIDNESTMGPYSHGNRFVTFIQQGGMEYDGGCTSGVGALRHEAYHSWWGRAVRPARQADGWIDEGWNTYHDGGGTGSTPLNFAAGPQTLCNRNPYSRVTPGIAYGGGDAVFNGIAATTSPTSLSSWMSEFYRSRQARPITTLDIESHLLARSGEPDIVDIFHRFVYGLTDPAPGPDLWIRDDPAHTGSEQWNDRFWDSPDLWIRNNDDGGLSHQAPIARRDNYFYARVRNQGTAPAGHFMVTFQVKQFAGVQFTWPGDFLPAITATGGFDLGPGQDRVVSARWPAAQVPGAGTHACWLASVLARRDRPISGRHVWEHGNLAQKNLTIVRARLGGVFTLPFLARVTQEGLPAVFEIRRPKGFEPLVVEVVPRRERTFEHPLGDDQDGVLDCGHRDTNHRGDDTDDRFDEKAIARFRAGSMARLRVPLTIGPSPLGLRLRVPPNATVGSSGVVDFVQLDQRRRVVGGIAIELHIDG